MQQRNLAWLAVAAGTTLASVSVILAQAGGQTPIYLDPKRPVEERVDDLMSRMTLKEKVGQLNLPCVYVDELGRDIPSKTEACKKFTAGTYTQEIGPACGFFTLANEILHEGARQQAEYFNELQKIALTQTRLKIPVMEDEEGTHGAMFPGGTVFPEGLAVGSSFDMDLVKAIYAAAAAEARAVGIHMLSTLVMEVDRDPRMGRNEEAYTEDPYLYMRIGETIVRATQGSDISAPDKVIAVLTDFPTQSEPASGLERGAIEVSERSLRENFMPPWIGAITKAGGLGVMAGYPEIEDVPAHASVKWMNDVLRQEIGFKGVVESEGGGFGTLLYEHIVPTQKEAGLLALRAGVDLNITYEPAYMGPLVESVEEGRVPMALVDRALRRVLELKFRLGLFENPYVNVDHAVQVVHSQANQDLALRAGREGIVLLKNDKNLLPLKKDLKSVAVIGPNADDVMNQLGDYSPKKVLQHVTTVIEGIKAAVSPQTKVTQVRGCEITGTDKSGFAEAVQAAKGRRRRHRGGGREAARDERGRPPWPAHRWRRARCGEPGSVGSAGGPDPGGLRDGNSHRRGAHQRPAAFHAVDVRTRARPRGGVGTRRAGRRSGGRRALWELQSHRTVGHLRAPALRPIAGLLQLQALQGLLDDEAGRPGLRRHAGNAALSLWLWAELYQF